ncbi:sugar transferase [Mameliella sediminis]|uniref:sugar transferase n=1 Tax=Mameliella sediminis TaxID=2836866 RepID=UPI001C492C62|nr:sugar transferase [Mameliella sediminis]MBV7395327.1 sugar transferase [Mameliella sediminis]
MNLRRSLLYTLDFLYAIGMVVLLSPLIIYVAFQVLWHDGWPIIYRSERMRSPDKAFMLWKFRTMSNDPADQGVTGPSKSNRITPTGAWLRRTRLDELPQLWNILRGDMGFVGPRAPLRRYVEKYPEIYAEVLKDRPGITGLASMAFHKTEERLLARTSSAEETEEVYCRRCIPRKAKLDLIYARRRNPCTDQRLMWATVFRRVSMHRRR